MYFKVTLSPAAVLLQWTVSMYFKVTLSPAAVLLQWTFSMYFKVTPLLLQFSFSGLFPCISRSPSLLLQFCFSGSFLCISRSPCPAAVLLQWVISMYFKVTLSCCSSASVDCFYVFQGHPLFCCSSASVDYVHVFRGHPLLLLWIPSKGMSDNTALWVAQRHSDIHRQGKTEKKAKTRGANAQTIYIHHAYRISLVITFTYTTIMNIWVASCNFTTEWLHNFWLSCNPVTLSEHHPNSNWNQTVVYSCSATYQVWNKSVLKCPNTRWCKMLIS